MSSERDRGEINISKIPVEGVGGLGLLAMAGITAYFVEPLRWLGVAAVGGGVAIAVLLVVARKRHWI